MTAGRAAPRRPAGALWTVLGGLALTAAASLAASGGGTSGAERAVFRRVNGLPGWLERPAWLLQLPGVLGVPLLVAAAALLARRPRLAAALVALVPLKLLGERRVLKELVERPRPGRTEPAAVLRGVPPDGLSFPSGHAIVATAVAVLLWPHLGRAGRTVAVLLALGVGVGRIYLGAHNPLDVVAGAGLGLLLGGLLTVLSGVRPPCRPTGPYGYPVGVRPGRTKPGEPVPAGSCQRRAHGPEVVDTGAKRSRTGVAGEHRRHAGNC